MNETVDIPFKCMASTCSIIKTNNLIGAKSIIILRNERKKKMQFSVLEIEKEMIKKIKNQSGYFSIEGNFYRNVTASKQTTIAFKQEN